jgi:hypothetical protein
MMTSASSVHRVSRSDGRGKARRGTAEPSIAGFKQSCMQFTNQRMLVFAAKWRRAARTSLTIGKFQPCCEISARECFKIRDYLL